MNKNVVKNLIQAMIDYGMENNWLDSEVIDALVDCGITETDFINNGYGDFVIEYFKSNKFNYTKDLVASKWELDCKLSEPAKVMRVQIGYSISDAYGITIDETEFDVEAYNDFELTSLFTDYLKETIKEDLHEDVVIDYVTIVATASSMEELVKME